MRRKSPEMPRASRRRISGTWATAAMRRLVSGPEHRLGNERRTFSFLKRSPWRSRSKIRKATSRCSPESSGILMEGKSSSRPSRQWSRSLLRKRSRAPALLTASSRSAKKATGSKREILPISLPSMSSSSKRSRMPCTRRLFCARSKLRARASPLPTRLMALPARLWSSKASIIATSQVEAPGRRPRKRSRSSAPASRGSLLDASTATAMCLSRHMANSAPTRRRSCGGGAIPVFSPQLSGSPRLTRPKPWSRSGSPNSSALSRPSSPRIFCK
mmetsp:Transcript_9273/g.21246  ORF Transcript_9273/g.21246 Transcript_9273/m.21246 type:complete len:273 (+) Transcript_9273:121-939(+)